MNKHSRFPIQLLLCLGMIWFSIHAARGQDPVLFYLGEQAVTQQEFLDSYSKNNPDKAQEPRLLKAYLERFIAYKLKVQDALDLGIDKQANVHNEIKNFTEQLSQPYLTDRVLLEQMLAEAYSHMRYDVHARQIMVRMPNNPTPKDTLEAFRIVSRIQERLIRGEAYEAVVKDEAQRNGKLLLGDHREQERVSSSDLKYFTVFAMPYPIEQYAFTANTGEFSKPIRTAIGYHIVEVLDRQPAMGKIRASQIFFSVPKNAPKDMVNRIRRKADSIYTLLIRGADFEELAREYSDDKISAIRGGQMSEFNVSHMDAPFIANLYKLQTEVVSRPFVAELGFHIVKLHSRSGILPYDQVKPELAVRLSRDERAQIIRNSYVKQLKKIHAVTEIPGALKACAALIDSNELLSMFMYDHAEAFDQALFKIGQNVYTLDALAKAVEQNQFSYNPASESFEAFLRKTLEGLISERLIEFESTLIQDKYPELKIAIRDYMEGILLFEISNHKVWNRSLTDSIGLLEFYESLKHCYMWPPRINALVFKYDIRKINTEDVRRFLTGAYKRKWNSAKIIEQAHLEFDPNLIKIHIGVYEPGQDKFADRIQWTQLGLSEDIAAGGSEKGFVYIYDYYPPSCKALDEIRGIMTSEYQKFLETEWLNTLHETYPIRYNDAVYNALFR